MTVHPTEPAAQAGSTPELLGKSGPPAGDTPKGRKRPSTRWDLPASILGAVRHRETFRDVEAFCMFIGYARSGHSLFGSLLNAHRHVVIAHELNVLKYVARGYTQSQIFALILRHEQWFAAMGRQWSGYDYSVPAQWQGRFERLRVIGDKRGSGSTRLFERDPRLLERLKRTIHHPVRFIHVVRNPFDNMTTMRLRKRRETNLDRVINNYFKRARGNAEVIRAAGSESVLTVRHEQIIDEPVETLRGLCRFLGVDSPEEYLADCAAIVFPSPRKTRLKIDWPEQKVREVEARIQEFEFLRGYSFES